MVEYKKIIGDKNFKLIVGAIIIVGILILGYNVFVPLENAVIRSFSKSVVSPGENIEVKFKINLLEDQTYYLISEDTPKEFEIIEGEHNQKNQIRLAVIQNAKSTSYKYLMKAPSEKGNYVFNGEYVFEGMSGASPIIGQNEIIVK